MKQHEKRVQKKNKNEEYRSINDRNIIYYAIKKRLQRNDYRRIDRFRTILKWKTQQTKKIETIL